MKPKFRLVLTRRVVVIVAVALALAALVVWDGLINVTRNVNPAFAQRLSPTDALALARLGDRALLASTSAASMKRAESYTMRAIAQDPTVAMAYRVLGFARERLRGREDARRLMVTSQNLSRRDLAAQLWLIEDSVRRDDAAGALQHFDIALRMSKTAPAVLFPILTNAAQDPNLRDPIAALLARRPAWRDRFLAFAFDNAHEIAPYAALAQELARRGSPLDQNQQLAINRKLVAQEEFDILAQRFGRRHAQRADAIMSQRNGSAFVLAPDLYPYSWTPADDSSVIVSKDPKGGLRFDVDASWNGELLKRLVAAPPGDYLLTASATRGLYVTVACAQKPNPQLGIIDLVGADVTRRIHIPATGCPAQWIIVGIRANVSDQPMQGRIDGIALRPE